MNDMKNNTRWSDYHVNTKIFLSNNHDEITCKKKKFKDYYQPEKYKH